MWSSPRRFASWKTQRNEPKCNELCKLSVTVTDTLDAKKTCASAQAGVNFVINPKVDFTYQYLWDLNSINPLSHLTSEQSQQHIAKCKQRFSFSIFCLTSLVSAHICDVLTGNLLEQAAIFRNTGGM
ncbi:hypothetical protein [Citrobacter sp.]|uniref:hypothetical protein n=1 Tax=Citrobacter sp. TaxID=1896336 RepID=UPI003A8AA7D2